MKVASKSGMRLGTTLGLVAAVLAMAATSSPTLAVGITIYHGQSSGSGSSTLVDFDSRFSQVTDIAMPSLDGFDSEGNPSALEVDLADFQVLMAAVVAANAKHVHTSARGNGANLGQTELFQPAGAVPDRGSTLALFGLALGGFAFFGLRRTRQQPVKANS